MPEISRRASSLGTENAFVVLAEVNALARQGRDIISFCIGQPDFPAPDNVQEAAIRAIKSGRHGYTPSAGIDELREAAARYLAAMRGGLPIRAEDVVIGAGAKPFIAYAVLSTTDYGAGDEVIYPNPGFPIYESQIVASGAKPVPLPLREARRFAFDLTDLEKLITPKTRLLILNYPHNPTGGLLSRKELEEIAAILRGHPQVWVYADEIYSRLAYAGEFFSIAQVPGMYERSIISDGASKTWAMTGWRIGFTSNPVLAPVFTRWITNTESCASQISQWAALEAIQALAQKAVLLGQLARVGVERGVALPPVDPHLLRLVDRGDDQAQLDGQELDVEQVDLDVSGDHHTLVEHALENVREVRCTVGPARRGGRAEGSQRAAVRGSERAHHQLPPR